MALNNLEDRLESAIRHINTSLDIDPWAQNLAVESMRMRIALMKDGQPEIIHCRECKYGHYSDDGFWSCDVNYYICGDEDGSGFCADAKRRTDGVDS